MQEDGALRTLCELIQLYGFTDFNPKSPSFKTAYVVLSDTHLTFTGYVESSQV